MSSNLERTIACVFFLGSQLIMMFNENVKNVWWAIGLLFSIVGLGLVMHSVYQDRKKKAQKEKGPDKGNGCVICGHDQSCPMCSSEAKVKAEERARERF